VEDSVAIDLHFICPHQKNWSKVEPTLFETGKWKIGEKTAAEAVGGRIYLHEKQSEPAWHGGTIISWRRSDIADRQIFTYSVDGPFRVVCTTGWGREKAIVRR
jgi:hypothetical protein